MKTRMLALATAATLALGAPAMAQDIDMGYNMLTGAIYNALAARNLPTDSISELSLTQIATIKSLLDSGASDSEISQRISAILEGDN